MMSDEQITAEEAIAAIPTIPAATEEPVVDPQIGQPPLISVIVSCYNHAQYLTDSVKSLLAQTYQNLEIIIVNDGSTDNTREVAGQCVTLDPTRVKFIDIAVNKGKWNALNEGISASTGMIVTSQDADDLAMVDRIKRQFDAMVATNTVHNLCGFHHCFSQEEMDAHKDERVDGDLKGLEPEVVAKMVEQGFMTPGINHYFTADFETQGQSAMFLKALWNIGFRFLPPEMGLRVTNSEDSDFNIRVTLALRNTSVLAEKLIAYRRNSSTNNEKK